MSEIARTGKWNPGGGRWLEVIATADVAGFVRIGTAVTVTTKAGKSWTRIYCTPGTIRYREQPQRSDNGLLYSYEIAGFSPDDTAPKGTALVDLLIAERVLCRFCDNQGLLRLAGLLPEPLTFDYDFDTDAEVPGSRGYALRVTGQTTQRAVYA